MPCETGKYSTIGELVAKKNAGNVKQASTIQTQVPLPVLGVQQESSAVLKALDTSLHASPAQPVSSPGSVPLHASIALEIHTLDLVKKPVPNAPAANTL